MKKASKPAPADTAHRQAVINARVSSKEQAKEGFSIPAQLVGESIEATKTARQVRTSDELPAKRIIASS